MKRARAKKKPFDLGASMLRAADQMVAIAKGTADPSTYEVHVPEDVNVKAIRGKLKLSQGKFAKRFGFAIGNIRDWEQGRSKPTGSTRVLLLVIDREPEAVDRVLRKSA